MDDALDNSKPHAGALELIGFVQPLEDTEQLVGVDRVEANPVVFYKIDVHATFQVPADFNAALLFWHGVFYGVG